MLKALDQVVDQNRKLTEQNQQLMERVEELRRRLAAANPTTPATEAEKATAKAEGEKAAAQLSAAVAQEIDSDEGTTSKKDMAIEESQHPGPNLWSPYTPNFGYKVANTPYGDLNISIYTYVRYLNQLGLVPTYTNHFGQTTTVLRQNDFQLQKAQYKFLGWVMNPKFRYFLYAWTSNASQGLGAQVVLAGNLNYAFNKYITFSGGITALPGTRSTEGNFPFWLSVDSRLMADEFFRPSYTSGIWARGQLANKWTYFTMLGNNLSTLGVSAAQLDNGLNTWSTAIVWMPTTGEFGMGFGDFEDHQTLATRFGAHYTRSHETKQSQPNSDAFENTQIRLTDGTVVFTPNVFGPNITVDALDYRMAAVDGGIKYHGFSLMSEGYFRWLSGFTGPGTSGLPTLFDDGLSMQMSKMVVPKIFQLYMGGSTALGQYGHPWDLRTGTNYFPFKNRVVRWNSEALYLYNSAAGYTAVPFTVGGHGIVFHTNLELAF
ncbi:MAG: hypothetical protein V4587_12730 [Acidobacteriota bacterium]